MVGALPQAYLPFHTGVTGNHVQCFDFRRYMRLRERLAPGWPYVQTHRGSATRREGSPTRMKPPRAAKPLLPRLCSKPIDRSRNTQQGECSNAVSSRSEEHTSEL